MSRSTSAVHRGASLGELEATAPRIVGDHGPVLHLPNKPLYLFRGRLVATADGRVTVDVRGGNHRALRLLIGQSAQQTFTTGAGTVFLHWQGRVPTVTAAANLKLGDRVIVRIRAAGGSTLADVEATPARGASPSTSRRRRRQPRTPRRELNGKVR